MSEETSIDLLKVSDSELCAEHQKRVDANMWLNTSPMFLLGEDCEEDYAHILQMEGFVNASGIGRYYYNNRTKQEWLIVNSSALMFAKSLLAEIMHLVTICHALRSAKLHVPMEQRVKEKEKQP